jgi:hypothetical protein
VARDLTSDPVGQLLLLWRRQAHSLDTLTEPHFASNIFASNILWIPMLIVPFGGGWIVSQLFSVALGKAT